MKAIAIQNDCLGNPSIIRTQDGVCILDIYRKSDEQYYNQSTGQRWCIDFASGRFIPKS